MDVKRRLALDLGSNSIGWAVFDIDQDDWPVEVKKAGVRIFHNSRNAKALTPLSVERRIARGARRRRDRNLQRKNALVNFLKIKKFLPDLPEDRINFSKLDPHQLRHEALTRKLENFEFGRIILHLVQRRGFLSNRKNLAKDEGGKSLGGLITKLSQDISASGAETLGSFLYLHCIKNKDPKIAATRMRADKTGWYPNRDMYKAEFEIIKLRQINFGLNLTDSDWDLIENKLFFQRPLKKQDPGRCTFNNSQPRCYQALPSFQRFRMLQQLANLKYFTPGSPMESLTERQREQLLDKLSYKEKLTYDEARKLLKRPEIVFNLETSSNSFSAAKHLFGDKTSTKLAKKDFFGTVWKKLDERQKDDIVQLLIDEEDDNKVRVYLQQFKDLSSDQIEKIVNLTEEDFAKGYCRFCREVVQGLSIYLLDNPQSTYDEAVQSLGYHHSDFRPEERLDKLPYYGFVLRGSTKDFPESKVKEEKEYGKIANPTVHVALNQLRKIVNALIDKYGKFDEIVVEVARDLPLGEDGIRQLAKTVKDNEKQNDKWRSELKELGLPDNFNNRLRLRLWQELSAEPAARQCVYSGRVISKSMLFSSEVEIDHILPRSITRRNHHSNLILCVKEANQFKKDRSPYDAFTSKNSPYDYEEVIARAKNLPFAKQRLFASDAMDQFKDEKEFLERQLNDTRYIARATGKYLQSICQRVKVARGGLTAWIRDQVNLNSLLSIDGKKNRNDHRHHAVDAFVIGLTPIKTLKPVEQYANHERRSKEPTPLTDLVQQFKYVLDRIVVSRKVDHSPSSKFFEETSYGLNKQGLLVTRKSIADITDYESIIDDRIREFILSELANKDKPSKEEKEVLAKKVYERFGALKARITKKDESRVEICHPRDQGKFKKWLIPLEITRVEFWQMPKSSSDSLEVVKYTSYEASHTPPLNKKPHPAAKKVLTIHKGDFIRLEKVKGEERTVIVESLRPAVGQILFTDHNISKNDDFKGRTISFGNLAKEKVRVVHVNELGEVKDPGAWWIDGAISRRNTKSGSLPERESRSSGIVS